MKKLIIAGGTGFLGQELCRHFKNNFNEIVILSREGGISSGNVRSVKWDAKNFGDWCKELEDAEAVINLCGKSVDCRYTEKNKAVIFSSRLDSTSIIGKAIQNCANPPKIWINGASATIYRNSENEPMTEERGEIGSGFSVEVCKAWEKVFNDFQLPKTRKINLRISLVFGSSGGVLPVMVKMVKRGLGGKMGSGKQQVCWIHVEDFCSIIQWMLENERAQGVYNIAAPEPVRNVKLMGLLRKYARMPFGLPAPAWLLAIGAVIIRTETELVLKSRYAVPEKLLKEGFQFRFGEIEKSIEDLVH